MLYPIGEQSFRRLRKVGYVYVDKTARMYELTSTSKCCFLSRPRRFGKSLLLSTMEAYFLGKRELFKGLAIEKFEKEWKQYPVLYLDLNSGEYNSVENLESNLNTIFAKWEGMYGSSETENTFEMRFKGIVERAYEKTGEEVVILVDEYDKPILTAIDNEELQEQFRSKLKSIYSVLKTQSDYIRFAFLTGVSKFSRLSVFSDLNNLEDITLDERYADICGISEKELHTYFNESIKELADKKNITYEEACEKLKKKYDGYHFAANSEGMYNPFSLLNALKARNLGDYWFVSGTPSFLVKMLKYSDYNFKELQNGTITANMLGQVETLKDSPVPMLYQCGYLTIKSYDERFDEYHLGFPNGEVETAFMDYLLPQYIGIGNKNTKSIIGNFVRNVEAGNAEGFMASLKNLLAIGKYAVAGELEIYFQNTMFLIFTLMGFYVDVEYMTSDGRIDVVVKTKDYIYVMELKVDVPAEKALEQIDSKEYMLAFADDGRKLYKIGVSFSSETRRISEYRVKSEE